jgi:integrase
MTSLVVSGRHPLARARQAKGRQGGAPRATNRPRPGLRWRRASGPLWARLDHVQVAALAAQAGSYGIFIRTLAYTGLRWGEATALRVRDVDINRRRLDVRRAYSTISGALIEGTPKSHQQRTVPLPKKLCEELAAHIDGLGPDDHVFTTASGTPVRTTNFRRRTWLPAVAATGLHGLTPHGLRHTACLPLHRGRHAAEGRPADPRTRIHLDHPRPLRPPLPRRHGHLGRPPRRHRRQRDASRLRPRRGRRGPGVSG